MHAQHVSHAYKRTPDVTLRRSLPGLPPVPSSYMGTGLLIVKKILRREPTTLSHAHMTHNIITPKVVEYINAAHKIFLIFL